MYKSKRPQKGSLFIYLFFKKTRMKKKIRIREGCNDDDSDNRKDWRCATAELTALLYLHTYTKYLLCVQMVGRNYLTGTEKVSGEVRMVRVVKGG